MRGMGSLRAAISMIEALVVFAIIAIIVGLLIPAVQQVREIANRVKCQNNMKQLGMGLSDYHNVQRNLPPGNVMPFRRYHGHSWRIYLTPYIDQLQLHTLYDFTADPERGSPYNNRRNQFLKGVNIPVYYCPSSPLPRWAGRDPGDRYMFSDYVAINGSIDSSDYYQNVLYPNIGKAFTGMFQDIVTTESQGFGGVSGHTFHKSGSQIRFDDATDGMSSTMLLAEQSDWCRDASGATMDCRAGYGDKMFSMGQCCADWAGVHTLQMTTVMHPIGAKSSSLLGVRSPHSPIQSIHPGGACILFCDGSVRFLMNDTAVAIVYRLADRNDGTNTLPP